MDAQHSDASAHDRLAPPWPTVLLRHKLPDGSAHIDWMLATDPDGKQPLVSFRLDKRIDDLPVGASIEAERIADHRPAYLTYEGPVSDDRGHVTRVTQGQIRAWRRGGDPEKEIWTLQVAWPDLPDGPARQYLRLIQQNLHRWLAICVRIDRSLG